MLDNLASEEFSAAEREAILSRLDDLRSNVDERIVAMVAKVEQAREFALQLSEVSGSSRAQLDRAWQMPD